ncbi:CBS domain-containing protein [Halobacillus sp. Marseille-Q1614]|uniref:CBS domain-containing protein n=1 Tax=Halobacillus sp. Marseille-Q1614 TaxID=2709134 RepID=UPI00156FF5CB|nr:CBS domain-containing protein [Halobacillus sp. Marseille-Q1614]
MKKVRDVMTTDVSVCQTSSTLYEAASLMKQQNVGAIPICDENGQLQGMVTDRDLVIRGYANSSPDSTTVQQVMSDHVFQVTPDTTLEEASQIMAQHQVRRLPVIENGKLAGIVSLGDLSLDEKSDQAAGVALHEISERPELH